jgi:MoaA/NifB/PqqE/SkfB family radical SAM enzyme
VTDLCFLPCVHCDIWKNKTVDLPTELWLDLISRLGPWCAPAGMNFVGGEPLMRKDLELLMAAAVAQGFEVSFNTNGHLVTDKRARSLSDAGVSIAYVSLDGIRKATIDHSRGRAGSFDRAMAAIDRLDAMPNPRVVIASYMARTRKRFRSCWSLCEIGSCSWCSSRSIRTLVTTPMIPTGGRHRSCSQSPRPSCAQSTRPWTP